MPEVSDDRQRPTSPGLRLRDDAAHELLEACTARFTAPRFEVGFDDRYTVWVKQTEGGRSVGLAPWLLRRHSVEELLERVDAKLGTITGSRASS